MAWRERIAWWLVCLLPRWLASKWIWSERVPMPQAWIPYVFGRSIGCYGQRVDKP